jgi:hypothetical protein
MELIDGAVRSIVTGVVVGVFEDGPVCPVDEPKIEVASNCGVTVPSLHELSVKV